MAIRADHFGGHHGGTCGIGDGRADGFAGRRRTGGPGRELSRWPGTGALPREAEEPLRSPGGLSGPQTATVAAREGRTAGPLAQVAALTAQVARLERDLYGPRPERHGKGSDAPSGQDGQGGGPMAFG